MSEARRPRFTYFGHSTVAIDFADGQRWLVDPWVQGNPSCPAALLTVLAGDPAATFGGGVGLGHGVGTAASGRAGEDAGRSAHVVHLWRA